MHDTIFLPRDIFPDVPDDGTIMLITEGGIWCSVCAKQIIRTDLQHHLPMLDAGGIRQRGCARAYVGVALADTDPLADRFVRALGPSRRLPFKQLTPFQIEHCLTSLGYLT